MSERRQIEWKVFFGVLTLLGLAIAARFSKETNFPEGYLFKSIIWISVLLIAAASTCFLFALHMSNNISVEIAEKAERAAFPIEGETSINIFERTPDRWPTRFFKRWKDMWPWFYQAAFLFCFSILAAVALTVELETSVRSHAQPDFGSNTLYRIEPVYPPTAVNSPGPSSTNK